VSIYFEFGEYGSLEAGYDAGYSGMSENDNPYPEDSTEFDNWLEGFMVAIEDAEEKNDGDF
jgi:ribosome modulation factor